MLFLFKFSFKFFFLQPPLYARDILRRALGLNRYENLGLWTAHPRRFQSQDVSLPEWWTRNWILDNLRDRLRLTEHKRATRNGDVNNHIAEHHLQTKHRIDWDSATCITYSTGYYQRLTLESWFTNLEQTPLNRSQQLPAPYKRLIHEIKQN